MPSNLRVKMNKRMTCFMEYVSKKKLKSRVDVYMEHLKQISNKEIYEIDDRDVLNFLIFKDVMIQAEQLFIKRLVHIWELLLYKIVLIQFNVV